MQIGFYKEELCDLESFKVLTKKTLSSTDVPNAHTIEKNVPIYDANQLQTTFCTQAKRQALMSEWANILHKTSGVFVIKNAQPNHNIIDAVSQIYQQIIDDENEKQGAKADHFATAGKNDRIWNSLQKLCLTAPKEFMHYFASPAIDTAAESWLGPNYQMTAQINVVHPGGAAQQVHRDYHLGFQSADISETYPAHIHQLSPAMTLQGGIAHCDMPIESGPTKLLPFSQAYAPGYTAWRREDFREYFENNYIQLPLQKGDALFFSPALFHAAGENNSKNIKRMVNLLQISSAFGRAMETVDRNAMCSALYTDLLEAHSENIFSKEQLNAIIASTAEGYSFPTNLDRDPPANGLAPQTQAMLMKECLMAGKDLKTFNNAQHQKTLQRQA